MTTTGIIDDIFYRDAHSIYLFLHLLVSCEDTAELTDSVDPSARIHRPDFHPTILTISDRGLSEHLPLPHVLETGKVFLLYTFVLSPQAFQTKTDTATSDEESGKTKNEEGQWRRGTKLLSFITLVLLYVGI